MTTDHKPDPEFYGPLAQFVNNFFYEDVQVGAYSYGGDYKFLIYKRLRPDPPFELTQNCGAFNWLLDGLHRLCSLHYKSLKEDTLKKYSGKETPVPKSMTLTKLVKRPASATPPIFIRDMFSAPPPTPQPDDPLADHIKILGLFEAALGDYGQSLGWPIEDKTTVDQFLHLPAFGLIHDKE